MAEHFPLKLVGSRMLAPSVRHLEFVRDDGQALDFIAGQFIQVHFNYPDGTPTKRSYSLATQHDHAFGVNDSVEIAVSFVPGGAASALFTALDDGQQIQCSGPYGRFCLNDKDQNARYLLIATGTGVTPYRAMLPQLKKVMDERGVQVVLVFGSRTEEDLIYREDFYRFAEDNPHFRFMPCFSREMPAHATPDARRGYVQEQLAELAAHGALVDVRVPADKADRADARAVRPRQILRRGAGRVSEIGAHAGNPAGLRALLWPRVHAAGARRLHQAAPRLERTRECWVGM